MPFCVFVCFIVMLHEKLSWQCTCMAVFGNNFHIFKLVLSRMMSVSRFHTFFAVVSLDVQHSWLITDLTYNLTYTGKNNPPI